MIFDIANGYFFQNMQSMLEGYLKDLSNISQEIQSLQEESASINNQLGNRKKVHSRLSEFVDQITISETMIQYVKVLLISYYAIAH